MAVHSTTKVAEFSDLIHVAAIVELINSLSGGFDIAQRTAEWIGNIILEGHAVIALNDHHGLLGFGCFEPMTQNGGVDSVGYSAIAVKADFHGNGIGRSIIQRLIEEGMRRYPTALHLTLTTNPALAAVFRQLKFIESCLTKIPATEEFWNDCRSCRSFSAVNDPESPGGNPTPCGHRCCCTAFVHPASSNISPGRKSLTLSQLL